MTNLVSGPPQYGLGGLPEGFSRLCTIHGGIFILRQDIDSIVFDAHGVAKGVVANGGTEAATADMLIGDPSYVMRHPPPSHT